MDLAVGGTRPQFFQKSPPQNNPRFKHQRDNNKRKTGRSSPWVVERKQPVASPGKGYNAIPAPVASSPERVGTITLTPKTVHVSPFSTTSSHKNHKSSPGKYKHHTISPSSSSSNSSTLRLPPYNSLSSSTSLSSLSSRSPQQNYNPNKSKNTPQLTRSATSSQFPFSQTLAPSPSKIRITNKGEPLPKANRPVTPMDVQRDWRVAMRSDDVQVAFLLNENLEIFFVCFRLWLVCCFLSLTHKTHIYTCVLLVFRS